MSGGKSKGSESKGLNQVRHMSILNEENLRAIIENIQVGIVLIDAETHLIMDLNAKAEEMIGCDRSYILGKECHEFIGPAKQGQYPIIDQGQKVDNAERILINWAGKSVPILKTVKKVVIDGHPYVLDSFVDLTEQMATLEALKESERKYRLLSDNSTDVIWILDFNTQKFTFYSPSVQKLRGYTPEEAMAIPLDKMMTSESYKYAMSEMKKGLDDESVPGIDPDRTRILQLEEICKDGSTVFVEAMVKILRDGNGQPIGIIGSSRDITERKKAELRQSIAYKIAEATYKSTNLEELLKYIRQEIDEIMDAKNFYIAFYDADSDFLTYPYFVDETENFSVPGRKFGSGLTEYVIKRDRGLLVRDDEIMQLIENGEIVLIGVLPLIWLGTPLRNKDRIIGMVAVQSYTSHTAYTHDDLKFLDFISSQIASAIEHKKTEEKLKQTMDELLRSNTELQHFAYIASHDLQEPLRMVSSYLQLIERRYEGKLDSDAQEFIDFAVDGANRMQTMINDLLTYSRVSTKGKPFAPTNCEEVMKWCLNNLQIAIEESGVVVTNDALPVIMADESQLIQLLQNLIGNAIKFHGEEKPRTHISVEEKEDEWQFSVKDNGIGMRPEDHEKIFDIFSRLYNKTEYPGTGIGLSVCKKIVERHGGRIWVESEPGVGSTFSFTIPKEDAKN
ncbi:MAG: PAS domain S-box protein [Candidatus Thermoplasmatota archaeon]|nr:PAS domain S-box protein [Euryarchaeota archaeon]MBU4032177.1 PAS domain S-box protein [Candidatus Thermoplasmatota archaeon]MBU4071031.1 PAS domain S-box protein [Candidatus Thermoplasmatota archaeon]MBU4145114.1 PAS domain S-box protein [Candidatus Thermoplasmatota archaeon]MBU4591020.1 PAS domain S-box protein [Candidatus Thermoplasmatota archaeon]